LFPGFLVEDISTTGATIRTLRAGSGPPLLLLHGYPQTHVIWHKIARHLTDRFTVVLTDLRGYGDSSKPEGGARHVNYSFRAMAQDQLEVMRHLGYERFYLGSHDRGAKTAHRLCLDHPEAIRKVCFLEIIRQAQLPILQSEQYPFLQSIRPAWTLRSGKCTDAGKEHN